MLKQQSKNGFTVKAYQGDAKTMLAFNITQSQTKNLAGFSISFVHEKDPPLYVYNMLKFADPAVHVQDKTKPANSSLNAPIQKFRWLHVPGDFGNKKKIIYGKYTYTVTPRYFDKNSHLLAIDLTLSVSVDIAVVPFVKGNVSLGFTRGFVQSQAFAHHFGPKALYKPAKFDLTFDTNAEAGKDSAGKPYTFKDEYDWSGFTARQQVFGLLQEVQKNKALSLDVFFYDFNEPDIINIFLQLAKEKRIRILSDNATLHHNKQNTIAEDNFETAFKKAAGTDKTIKRGHFSRFQHNKVFLVKKGANTIKVLAGSTNFSVTGMYVNANHVLVFDDPKIAAAYQGSFDEAWNDDMNNKAFAASAMANKTFPFKGSGLPEMNITFSPHTDGDALKRLTGIADRVDKEKSSVLFAIMDTDPTVTGPISPTIKKLHSRQDIFSYGITDSSTDIFLYKPNEKGGIKVTGKPGETLLPPPFDKEKSITMGHQIHHKFIVAGFNTADAVVWCGSSNLAQGGEGQNGDNLIEIHDQDIATVFAIEAFALVDHFLFRDTFSAKKNPKATRPMTLWTDDHWTKKYFNKNDIRFQERMLW